MKVTTVLAALKQSYKIKITGIDSFDISTEHGLEICVAYSKIEALNSLARHIYSHHHARLPDKGDAIVNSGAELVPDGSQMVLGTLYYPRTLPLDDADKSTSTVALYRKCKVQVAEAEIINFREDDQVVVKWPRLSTRISPGFVHVVGASGHPTILEGELSRVYIPLLLSSRTGDLLSELIRMMDLEGIKYSIKWADESGSYVRTDSVVIYVHSDALSLVESCVNGVVEVEEVRPTSSIFCRAADTLPGGIGVASEPEIHTHAEDGTRMSFGQHRSRMFAAALIEGVCTELEFDDSQIGRDYGVDPNDVSKNVQSHRRAGYEM